MGYACPVCATPQRDGEHLANHLAFTAMLRHEDHEAWLDDHVDGWTGMRPSALAAVVVPHAEETDFESVFEDTVEGGQPAHHDHSARGHDHDHDGVHHDPTVASTPDSLDDEAEAVVREARELTRQMLDDADSEASSESASASDSEDEKA